MKTKPFSHVGTFGVFLLLVGCVTVINNGNEHHGKLEPTALPKVECDPFTPPTLEALPQIPRVPDDIKDDEVEVRRWLINQIKTHRDMYSKMKQDVLLAYEAHLESCAK